MTPVEPVKVTPQVAVVMLNLNQGRYLRDAIESLLADPFENWSLTIRDPGSTDGSKILYSLPVISDDPRIKVVRTPDSGPAGGLNGGFSMSDSEYCYYLNSDDRLVPGAMAEAVDVLNSTGAHVVLGNGSVIDQWGHTLRPIYSDRFTARDYVVGRCVAVQQATFFRRDALADAGWFNEMNRVSWDGEILFRCAMRSQRIVNHAANWGEFRIYAGTITSDSGTRERARQELDRLRADYERRHGRIRGVDSVLAEILRRGRSPSRTMRRALRAIR